MGYMSHNARGEDDEWEDGCWCLLLLMAGKSPLPPDTLAAFFSYPFLSSLYNEGALIKPPAHVRTHTVHIQDWLICYRLLMHIAA